MRGPGHTRPPAGATFHRSATARFTLAAGLLTLGIGDLAVINTVLLPRYLATSQGASAPPTVLLPAIVPSGAALPSQPAPPPPAVPAPPPLDDRAPSLSTSTSTSVATSTVDLAVDFPDLLFALNTTWLSRPSRETLDRVAEVLRASPGRRVVLSGHTDDMGPRNLNRALSRARARRASRYLQGRGIDAARIDIQGLGSSPPVDGEPLAAARARNRRVEIAVH
jgi:outer membrane protein OmpA-like peptidoglycan-associated protein